MRARDVCNPEVAVISRDATLLEAARRMREYHVGTLILVADEDEERPRPLAILTDRDIVVGPVAEGVVDIGILGVSGLPHRDLVTVSAADPLDAVLCRMVDAGVRRVPVVDDDGRLVGICSLNDLLEALVDQLNDLVAVIGRSPQLEEALHGRRR